MEQKDQSAAVITIFGSALPTEDSEQYRLAYDLGKALAEAGFKVATGGHSGVMEAASRGASEGGGHVIGVLAHSMPRKANRWIEREILVDDWEERLQKLIQIGAGYVVLNGGTGTLVELAVAWEMMAKRIIPCRPLVALGDFWRPLAAGGGANHEIAGRRGVGGDCEIRVVGAGGGASAGRRRCSKPVAALGNAASEESILKEVKWAIRKAHPDDARGIADVHVASWKTTYAGILPQNIVELLSCGQREERWRDILSDPAEKEFVFLAMAYHGRIVGFASGEPERKGDPIFRGEISSIYIHDSYHRMGIGRQLVSAVAAELLKRGFSTLLIRVLAANPACGFYEALGGRKLYESEAHIGGVAYPDVAYGWDDIRKLVISEAGGAV